MDDGLLFARADFMKPVRIQVAEEQRHLDEEHAGAPHGGGAAEPGQDHFGDDGLDLDILVHP